MPLFLENSGKCQEFLEKFLFFQKTFITGLNWSGMLLLQGTIYSCLYYDNVHCQQLRLQKPETLICSNVVQVKHNISSMKKIAKAKTYFIYTEANQRNIN